MKLSENVYNYYTQIKSQVKNKLYRYVGPKKVQIWTNKTQYDWFPGKSQNSKKFSAKCKQNPTTSKNHGVFLNILGG